jgi:dihydroxyacetone kinase-like predicted kinase
MTAREELDAAAVHDTVRVFRDGLVEHREAINQLNVYPVPDGDTGTNMSLTMESVLAELETADGSMESVCKAIAHGSLMGARGNSGVIMSQILRGITDTIDADTIGPDALAAALTAAATAAYGAVMKPVEGTILTVARETGEAAAAAAAEGCDLEAMLRRAAETGAVSLERTPELLSVLADAGVVDAGGRGYLLLIDALINVVAGDPMPEAPEAAPVVAPQAADGHDEHRY